MTNMYVFPVKSQSYATAAFTTGTINGFPIDILKPETLTSLSVNSYILALLPATGESAWLSNYVADIISLSPFLMFVVAILYVRYDEKLFNM